MCFTIYIYIYIYICIYIYIYIYRVIYIKWSMWILAKVEELWKNFYTKRCLTQRGTLYGTNDIFIDEGIKEISRST